MYASSLIFSFLSSSYVLQVRLRALNEEAFYTCESWTKEVRVFFFLLSSCQPVQFHARVRHCRLLTQRATFLWPLQVGQLVRGDVAALRPDEASPQGWAMGTCTGIEVYVDVDGKLDVAKEKDKLERKRDALRTTVSDIETQESAANYASSVSEELRSANVQRKTEANAEIGALERALAQL
jgi:valyl-tRNA synthetase